MPYAETRTNEFFIGPDGVDKNVSGRVPAFDRSKHDFPFLTFEGAVRNIRKLRDAGRLAPGPVTVYVRGGRYELDSPLTFGPDDGLEINFVACENEEPVVDGGRRITGWEVTEHNGRTCWKAHLPEVKSGEWNFRQLFVDGRRRPRPCVPKTGFNRIAGIQGVEDPREPKKGWGGCLTFYATPEDFPARKNVTDADVVVPHWWVEERSNVASIEPGKDSVEVTLRLKPRRPLIDPYEKAFARLCVENVFEALSEPGEWYLDRRVGELYYLPRDGEDPETTEVYAPRLDQLVRIVGDVRTDRPVEGVCFLGITFRHATWDYPDAEWASANQSDHTVPGAIYLEAARRCAFEDCHIEHVGGYGVEIADACVGIRVVGCEIHDLGAGGVKINGADAAGDPRFRTGNNAIADNHIHDCGHVFLAACGILARHTFGNVIAHNHIHGMSYSGISVGWQWNYEENVARDNLIEKNHVHGLIDRGLFDMGLIYTLGVQPGTVIRGNLLHNDDADGRTRGIYPDEGSSHMVIEDNVVHSCEAPLYMHFGRECIVRNNVFAFGSKTQIGHGRALSPPRGMTIERNVIITDGAPVFTAGYAGSVQAVDDAFDLNCLWDTGDKPLTFTERQDGETVERDLEFWRGLGRDLHSVVADPKCRDLEKFDFTPADDSPALERGFRPIDTSDVGPRDRESRG